MAKQTWNNPIDKNVDWGGDATTGNLPVSGEMVQRFIKESLDGKAGLFYYDSANNRYLVFADAETRDEYLLDPTQTELIIGTFDAPFNYTAEISLTSAAYNAVFLGSTGNYIDFTFDIKNKQGASTGENVTVTYTFIRNATRQVVKETRKFGDSVHFNIDKYIGEGTNTIIVGVTGQTTLAATTVAITYQVVNLVLTDDLDISKSYNLVGGAQTMEIPFTVSGYGTKVVEWYLDGEMLDFVKAEDEVVDVSATRTKYITLSNLQQGRHSLQIRAYTVINGENFYTDTLYRDVIVYTGADSNVIIGVAVTIPRAYGILGANDAVAIYDMVQYVPYTLRFATYSPTNASNTDVTVTLGGEVKGTIGSVNGSVNEFSLVSTTSGSKTLVLAAGSVSYTIMANIAETTMSLQEITDGLVLDFNALGKSNNSSDKAEWSYGDYTGTLTGFNWNNTSGWVDGRLEMNAGSSFAINMTPLAGSPTSTGKTIEIEWSTKNVTNDEAVICDLRNSDGVGILITATKVSMTSADGVVVETEYKSDENVRVGFVINRSSGTTNQRLSFIYANGIVSRGEKWAINDSYASDAEILFTATSEAEISLKAIRIYDAALTSDQMLNNYTLYRDTVSEMMEVYDRNDVYEEGTTTFSPDKMMGRLPVMIVTGDIPTLENTSDKDTQIVVDIDYYNMQDTSKSFRMVGAAMRPQGTSSMGYPKKNFRIYTEKVDGTVLYDSEGNVVTDKLYSFKDGAQPVNCWCLKADYAESSGTHNTGIARLWNEALMNAQVDGEYVCRTEAQKAAMAAGYEYDVRTTIDGFPILLFYRPTATDDVIFIGKYNFNNDKSTESVFGFKGIPNFDNSRMQCWEVLNNGNALALFTTVDRFDEGWAEAFESRYPDTSSPNIADLKAFCEWMTSVSQEDFATQKWEHLNVYMMAAYWCYLMRHAGADQFVKNAMFTSEDGEHFYYILYDNDTINGLINTGRLRIKPTDDRQTVDESGSYVFAGHDSRLWNLLEADDEFKDIVSAVDNALYSAGISYANTIRIFDEEQADKWVEKVYNQDAQYKYVGPYVEKGIDNLFMLQGKRDLHRRWWLAKRFSIYDAKYVSGTYKSQAVELKCINGTPAGQTFTVTAGYPLDYGFGINNVPREFGITLDVGESHTFTTEEVVNLGDPIRIYGAPNIAELDLSPMASQLAVITVASVYDEALGTKLTKLVVGKSGVSNAEVTEISGLKQATALEYLDVQGMTKILSLDLSSHAYIKTVKAKGSGIASITFAKGAPVTTLELPSSMRVLSLEQLPYLTTSGIAFENIANLAGITVLSCPNISNDFAFVNSWVTSKTTTDASCSLIMDNVNWSGVSGEQMARIASIGANGGTVSLKGKVVLTDITEEQGAIFEQVFGDTVFNENAEFYIDAPTTVTLSGAASLLEGESATYTAKVYPPMEGTVKYSLPTTRTGCSINATTGVLTTAENGLATSNIVIRATFTPSNGEPTITRDYTVSVVKRTYPSNATISGGDNPIVSPTYAWSTTTSGVNGDMTATWTLSGDIVNYVEVKSSSLDGCTLAMTYPPLGVVNGTLTLTLKKAYNGATILTATKSLSAELDGVIITGRSNAPIQASLYNAGLVANETYTLESEAEAITAAQLQTGTTAATSIFYAQRANITSFDEFRYFTGVTSIPAYCFANLTKLSSIVLPPNIVSIGANSFENCSALRNITFEDGITSLGVAAFQNCSNLESLYIPKTLTSIGSRCFIGVNKLYITVDVENQSFASNGGVLFNKACTTLLAYTKSNAEPIYVIPEGVTAIEQYVFTQTIVTNITLPSTLYRIANNAFLRASKLSAITSLASIAPTAGNSTFGATTGDYTGRSTYASGTNRLRIPLNATGYEAGLWLDPLQNASKCGFSIHGKLTITSNRSEAQFTVQYTTEAGATKSVTVGVGTSFLSDIKYNENIRITPQTLSGYTWQEATKLISYNGATTVDFNAYIYPSSVAISGKSTVQGGYSDTYTATISPSNIDVDVTYNWLLSYSANASISSSNGNQCTITTNAIEEEENLTLICQVTTSDGKTVDNTYAIKLITRPNFITATYNVTSTSSATQLLYSSFSVSNVTYMEIDGVEVTPVLNYTFSSTGTHTVKMTLTTLYRAFDSCSTLTSIDFTECNGTKYDTMYFIFYSCSKLTSIEWGECTFPNVTTLAYTFYNCSALTSIDLSPLAGAPITTLQYTFYSCSALTSIDLSPLAGAPITTLQYAFRSCPITSIDLSPLAGAPITNLGSTFYSCSALTSIEWGECTFPNVTSLAYTFRDCSSLNSIDLSPLEGAEITDMESTFYNCSSLNSIDLSPLANRVPSSWPSAFSYCLSLKTIICPWSTAPTVQSNCFGTSTSNYTGRNTYNTGQNMLIVPTGATGYDSSYWGSVLLDSTKCGFTIASNGVFIQHIDGSLLTESAWTSAGYANNQANGVAVLSDECSFVIAKDVDLSTMAEWGGYGTAISDIVTTTSSSAAILDYDGTGNTTKIITQLGAGNAPAAETAVAYTFPDGKTGYLGALGEWQSAINNIVTINNAMEACGGTIIGYEWWSSTQYSKSSSWSPLPGMGIASKPKDEVAYVRAFTTLF